MTHANGMRSPVSHLCQNISFILLVWPWRNARNGAAQVAKLPVMTTIKPPREFEHQYFFVVLDEWSGQSLGNAPRRIHRM